MKKRTLKKKFKDFLTASDTSNIVFASICLILILFSLMLFALQIAFGR